LVNHLALDDKYLYWTTEGGGNLFRYALASSKDSYATIITSTQFDKGKLQMYPAPHLIRAGNWLIFDDHQITVNSHAWALHAINVVNQTRQNLAQSQDSDNLYSFSSDGEWVAWITADLSLKSIINVQNLQTGQHSELPHSDSSSDAWEQVVVSAGQLAATKLSDDGRVLYLFDLKSGQGNKLYADKTGSDMAGLTFDGNWIAWKTGTNYQGSTALYNLQAGKFEMVPISANNQIAPLLTGQWLAWDASADQPLLIYNLERRQGFLVVEAQAGDNLSCVAIHANVIAWCRVHPNSLDLSSFDSTVEWRTLP